MQIKENHMLPFFWQHGEDEKTLREYVGVIKEAGCGAFCVESRPHPDFCGPKWWQDMDVILDEANKLDMKVWILDDSHFPSGYANGALKDAPNELCRQSVITKFIDLEEASKAVELDENKLGKPVKLKLTRIQKTMLMLNKKFDRKFDDDSILSVVAFGPAGEVVDLTGKDSFEKPEGKWKLAVNMLSRNYGPHKTYINMMNKDSVRVFLDACYEPHFEHYERYFGNTILGFFSDEPELGNGLLYAKHNKLGQQQDLPWSAELQEMLKVKWGEDYSLYLPYLWDDTIDKAKAQEFRVCYMDCVTALVRDDFSYQIGNWCREHGVMYMGHSIEDDDTHYCTGSGLGHYFRGLEGQDYSGIDVIGGQVIPQGEDEPVKGLLGPRNGGFYHYTLAKLGSSFAYLDENKQGRAMCEIFGNYGWKSGVYEQKYLADHCLVRGINNFVPHAFSPKAYPDSDCPPHFYAHGHNPQYRAFGQLCRYMNRVADLISRGKMVVNLAIFYNAESDWAGECMSLDKPARELYDNQMDYIFLPSDYSSRAGEFKYVIVPEADFVPHWLSELENAIFINSIPGNLSQVKGQVVMLEELAGFIKYNQALDVMIEPANNRIRVLHYKGEQELYMAVNEGTVCYQGRMSVSAEGEYKAYDPWADCFVDASMDNLVLGARKSLIFIKDAAPEAVKVNVIPEKQVKLTQLTRSICKGIDYPKFQGAKIVALPDDISKEDKLFSGFVRYETRFAGKAGQKTVIRITEPEEAIEVFVNGKSCGIQIVPDYIFDVTEFVCDGENALTIEMATTLGRENSKSIRARIFGRDTAPTGITGEVYLCQE